MKKCYICKEEKELTEFYTYKKIIKTKTKGTYEKTYHFTKCKECSNKITIEFLKNNPDKKKKNISIWRNKNKEKLNKQSAESMKKRRVEKKEQYDSYIKNFKIKNYEKIKKERVENYEKNIQIKTRYRIRSKIREALKRYLKNNKDRFIKELGCYLSEYKVYIEKQFREGMYWKNWGVKTWHIDHKMPCCKFDLTQEEEILKCFNYLNTQPLFFKENLNKNRVYINNSQIHE